MPATSNTFRHQPRSRGLFLGVERGHALPGQPDRGTSADPDPTASRGRSPGGPAWNSASSLPRFRAGTRVSLPGRRRRHRGWGALFCASGFAGLLNRRRNATGFICISSLPALKALARSHLHRTRPIGGCLRAKNANSNDMSGRGPPVGYANTLSLSPAGDTQPPAHHTWLFGPDVLSGGRGGLILPPGDTQP